MIAMIPGARTKTAAADQKHDPGAYLLYQGRVLCRVIGIVGSEAAGTAKLKVENARDGSELVLSMAEVHAARLVRGHEPTDQLPECPTYLPEEL